MNLENEAKSFQTAEESQELMLQQLENLFDKPTLTIRQNEQQSPVSITNQADKVQLAQVFEVVYQKDYLNTSFITNPSAIFSIFNRQNFLELPEQIQLLLLERLEEILCKCPHNTHILTDHIILSSISRKLSKAAVSLIALKRKDSDQDKNSKYVAESKTSHNDLILLTIQLALKLTGRNSAVAKKLLDLQKQFTRGKRFLRAHVEYIYQYLKNKCQELCKKGRSQKAMEKIEVSIKMLLNMFEQQFDAGPTNYFYFSGYLSGIQVHTKQQLNWPFLKGFAATLWFSIQEQHLQDPRNLPVLFNCFSEGFGGFECYFNQKQLFYRILAKKYTPPTVESNGVLIAELQTKKWYFFAIEQDKPFLGRPQLSAIINDKQVLNLPMDYPTFGNTAKLSMITICANFVGQMSSFMLFKEHINNTKTIIKIYNQYEYGVYSNSQLKQLKTDVFDSKLIDKLYLCYSPERTQGKLVYDCIELSDGELMVNSGVCSAGPKSKIFYTGGLHSLLPLLELINTVSQHMYYNQIQILDKIVNDLLKLVNAAISSSSQTPFETENSNFFNLLFYLISNLPQQAVNNQTISLLAEIRFEIGDSKLQDDFFKNLMLSSDYWINTNNIEVINEYWSFVKAIYSQSPIQYNKIFSLQNLIDLMIKISDIKDGHCCDYHKNTYLMFYQGNSHVITHTDQQNRTNRQQNSSMTPIQKISQLQWPDFATNINFKTPTFDKSGTNNLTQQHKIYNIDKYLTPIAGVLEAVLTSGGNEILDQIQHIAKALIVKSSPCFHLQMLKLLKVLLLDSREDKHCASPVEFAVHFLNAKGLQILLYLCSNSSFDVKSMCIKLIDVLSSHTSHIKIRIDTELITYLSTIILPKQMIDGVITNQKTQMYKNLSQSRLIQNDPQSSYLMTNQYQMVDEQEEEEEEKEIYQEDREPDMDKEDNLQQNQQNKFYQNQENLNDQLNNDDQNSDQYSSNIQQHWQQQLYQDQNVKQKKPKIDLFIENEEQEVEQSVKDVKKQSNIIQQQAKKSTSFQKKDQEDKIKLNQTNKDGLLGYSKGLAIQEIDEEDNSEDDQSHVILEPASKRKFINTQKIPTAKEKGSSMFKAKGLELSLPEEATLKYGGKKIKNEIIINDEEEQKIISVAITEDNDDEYDDRIFQQAILGSKSGGPSKPSKQKQQSFANENVMSNSNLRQQKKFSFGFSPGADDEKEEEQSQDSQEALQNQEINFEEVRKNSQPILMMQRPQFGINKDRAKRQKPEILVGGTTGATNETQFDTSYSSDKPPSIGANQKAVISFKKQNKLFTNSNAKLNIDTEAINELFTYGGEKGDKVWVEGEEENMFESELDDLAGMCVSAMKRKDKDDPIEYESGASATKSTFEAKYLSQNKNKEEQKSASSTQTSKGQRAQFNVPQTVRGIKKIDFQSQKQSVLGKTGTFSNQTILEENSPIGTSKSSSSKQEFGFGATNSGTIQLNMSNSDIFTKDPIGSNSGTLLMTDELKLSSTQPRHISNKSQSILISGKQNLLNSDEQKKKAIINKKKSFDLTAAGSINYEKGINNQIGSGTIGYQIEKTDGTDEYTTELENLYTSCLEWILNRAPSSLYQNIVIDDFDKISFTPALSLLMTLVSYSNNLVRQKSLQDLLMLTRWDAHNGTMILFHPHFHNWLLDLLMPYQDLANSFSNLQGMSLAVYDIGYSKTERDIETAHKLTRVLLTSLISNLKEEAIRQRPQLSQSSPTWKNLLHITQLVEELILSSHQIDLATDPSNKKKDTSNDVNASMLKWIQNDYLFYGYSSNDKQTWAEWDMLEVLFQALDVIFPESFFSRLKDKGSRQSVEENIYNLLEKSSPDEFNHDIDILMFEGKSIGSTTTTTTSSVRQVSLIPAQDTTSSQKTKTRSHNPLSYAAAAFTQAQNQFNPLNLAVAALAVPQQATYSSTFMKTVLNILCVALTQAETKPQIIHWLNRLERYVKFLMIVSETWKTRQINHYNLVQRRFSEALTFAFTFLFNEIHSTNNNRQSAQSAQQQQQQMGSTITSQLSMISGTSPKDFSTSKLYAQTLKNIMIYFINIIEYSRVRFTPSQLETNSNLTACRHIFNNVLVKYFYSQGQTENLITINDITRFKASDYEDFPECFYLDDWKVTFFNSDAIKKIVNKQLSYSTLEQHQQKRKAYALHIYEMQQRTDKTKDEILKRMQNDTLEVISTFSELEFERKNKVALLCENLGREQKHYLKKIKQNLQSSRGAWKNFISDSCTPFLKSKLIKTIEGTRSYMRERNHNGFIYIKNEPELEKKIFRELGEKNDQYQISDFYEPVITTTLVADDNASNIVEGVQYESIISTNSAIEANNDNLTKGRENKDGKQSQIMPSSSNPSSTISHKKELKLLYDSEEADEQDEDNNSLEEEEDDEEEEEAANATKEAANNEMKKLIEGAGLGAGGGTSITLHDYNMSLSSNLNQYQPIVQFFSKMLTNREKIALKKSYISHLKDYVFQFRPKTKEILELKCSLLKPLYQRPGVIIMTSLDIVFFDDLYIPSNTSNEADNIFFFKYAKSQDQLLYKIIPLTNIKEIQRRRFLGRKSALEIFMMDDSTVLLNFNSTQERDQFSKKITRQRNSKCNNLKYYNTLDAKKVLKKRELTEKWMQWKISNYEYLMQLNMLGGRSFNDLSQYPVFPWILMDYQSDSPPDLQAFNAIAGGAAPGGFRDLNKNMQLLGSAERQAKFKSKYEDADSFTEMNDKFHCGSHYSNPGIVLHYLTRISPYTDAYVELHGKSLDKPDRTFYSIQESLFNALNDHSDVRELIPEFFFLPEMFLNLNQLNFGIKQDGSPVDDVVLPLWCNQDPYLFVLYLREAIESPYVSQNLGGWIDYIFGSKQKDIEAEKNLNTFSILTYEDGIDLDKQTDEFLKNSYKLQIYNYGQTPSQLFDKNQKHPGRQPKQNMLKYNYVVDVAAKIKVYKPVSNQTASSGNQLQKSGYNKNLICNEAIFKSKFQDEDIIMGVCKDGSVIYFKWYSKSHELNPNAPFTCCEDKKKKFDNRTKISGIDQYDRSIKKFDFPMIIMTQGKSIVRGGFWDGKIVISPFDSHSPDQQQTLTTHQSTVTSIALSSNERTVITGAKLGDVIVWNHSWGNQQSQAGEPHWQIRKHLCDHEGQISTIYINEDMNMYVTASFDGTANLYNLWNDSHMKTFYHPSPGVALHSVILTSTPLAACCFYSRNDHHWYSFSLNGHFLDKAPEECDHIISAQVIKDSYFMDKLVYGSEKGCIILRQLPLLKQIKKQLVSNNFPVMSILVSPDRRFLLVGCGDGGLNVITDPNIVVSQNTPIKATNYLSTSGSGTGSQQQLTDSSQQ